MNLFQKGVVRLALKAVKILTPVVNGMLEERLDGAFTLKEIALDLSTKSLRVDLLPYGEAHCFTITLRQIAFVVTSHTCKLTFTTIVGSPEWLVRVISAALSRKELLFPSEARKKILAIKLLTGL